MKTEFLIPPQHLGKTIEVHISIKSGDVSVHSSDGDMIEVDLPDLRKGTLDEMFEMTMYDNKLTIKEKKPSFSGMNFLNFGNSCSDMTLSLPKSVSYSGELSLYNGDLSVQNVRLSGSVNTYNGDISFQNTEADHLKVNSYNGDLSMKNYKGGLAVEQFNGDISCQGCELTAMQIKSFSGDIEIRGSFDLKEDGVITTMSGDISLNAEKYLSDKYIRISTMSGDQDIQGNIPEDKIIVKNQMRNHGMEFMKGFKPMMKGIFGSIGGSMTEQKDQVKTEVFNTSDDKREAAEKKDANIERILQMLADGKINFEESERLINLLKGL